MKGPVLFWLRLMGLATAPALLTLALPPMGMALQLLAPLPLAYGTARRGLLEGVFAVSLVSLATTALLGGGSGFFFWLQTVPLVAGVAWILKSRLPAYLPALGGTALVAMVMLAGLALSAAVSGMGMDRLWWETADPLGALSTPAPATPEGADPAAVAELVRQMEWLLGIWKRLFIGIWVSSILLLLLFFSVLTRGFLVTRGHLAPPEKPYLAGWYLPWPFVGAFILLATGALFLPPGPGKDAAANALIPLAAVYGIAGMAVAGHMLGVWRVPPAFRFLAIFLAALWSPQAFLLLLVMVGLFDNWFDFRRRFTPGEKGKEA